MTKRVYTEVEGTRKRKWKIGVKEALSVWGLNIQEGAKVCMGHSKLE